MLVLITGAGGMLGITLSLALESNGHKVIRISKNSGVGLVCDLIDLQQTRTMLQKIRPEVIINLAAMTDVDGCQIFPHQAYLHNVRIVENLVNHIRTCDNPPFLIQMSSDQVYDSRGPSKEGDERLSNVYSFSKYAGEIVASKVPAMIIRTNFFGYSKLKNRDSFSDWIIKALLGKNKIKVFDDVIFNPLNMDTLSNLTIHALQQKISGIFNLGSINPISKSDFSFEVANTLGLSTFNLERASVLDLNLSAYRPSDMSMDCQKFMTTFGVQLPCVTQEIAKLKGLFDAHHQS